MNFKLVLKAYATLRQLTDDESALLTTLRGMTDTERDLLVESLAPAKAMKPASKPRGKSPRAASLAGAITGTAKPAITLCGATLESSGTGCGLPEGHALHADKGYVDYHPFVATPPAPRAARQSSAKSKLADEIERVEGDRSDDGKPLLMEAV